MKKLKSFPALILALIMMAGVCPAAQAEVMTLGVYFCGQLPRADGNMEIVRLEGSFRVLQNGLEIGRIDAGGETLMVTGNEKVTLEPVPETVDPAWDLTDAVCEVEMTDGTVIVPVLVSLRKTAEPAQDAAGTEDAEAGEAAQAAEAENMETGETEAAGAAEGETGETGETVEGETGEAGAAAAEATAEAVSGQAMIGEGTLPTPVPETEATASPEITEGTAGDAGALVRVQAFMDGNNNGEMGPYEEGAEGITLYMIAEDGSVAAGAVTGKNGIAELKGLPAGTYRLRASLPGNLIFGKMGKKAGIDSSCMDMSAEGVQDSAQMSLRQGEILETGLAVMNGLTVSGVCWLDENGDGIMDSAEQRIAGARITMKGQKNGLEFETYSGENGEWKMTRIRAGFYDLTSYAPEGMMFTRYSKTGGKNRSIFTTEGKTRLTRTLDTNDGKSVTDQNIGFTWTASVSGLCFLDANYNGLPDEGEKPLAGVKVTAIKQVKDEEIAVAFSGEDGRYTLSGLRGNTYRIRAVLPDDGCNFTAVTEDPLGNHFTARENRRENFWNDFVLSDGEKRTVNVGAIYYGSVSGTVYMDNDFSASQNGSEKAVQGVSVSLVNEKGELIDQKSTNAKGGYTFEGLVPGLYSLRMTAKEGYAFTRLGEGNIMLNLNGGEGYSEPFQVPLGTAVTGMNAGMIEPGTVEGAVFADRNDNGRRDAGEEGLSGAVVRLMSEDGEAFSATIGETGSFLFDAVMPGKYYLQYEMPEGGVFATVTAGGNEISGENGIGKTDWFSFATGDLRQAPVCGGLTLGTLEGLVFRDHDGSGLQTEGEEPVAGAVIELIPGRNDLETISAVTGADGSFRLDQLHPDDYTLHVALPDGLVTSRLAGTKLPMQPGIGDQQAALAVSMGEKWEAQQISAVLPARLRGRVWLDENNDGRMDEGEKTPRGIELTLIDEETGNVFATLKTDDEGAFEAAGMIPGSFSLSMALDVHADAPLEGDSTFVREGSSLVMKGISLAEGESREDPLLGLVRYTTLAGSVWIDRGGTVEPLAGVGVTLEGEDGSELAGFITDETGRYEFGGLMPGTYRIMAELPEGCVVAEPTDERLQNGLISILTETEGRNGVSDPIALRMGDDQTQLNIGSVLPGTIGDYCWLDENGNGWQDGGEYGIPGVKVELQRGGVTVAETVTNQYGLYWFREVYPAVYTLKITPPAEVKPTQKRTDIYLIVSSVNETEDEVCFTDQIAVQSDVTNFNVDLGFVLRKAGVYPAGYGEGETMDWSREYAPKE